MFLVSPLYVVLYRGFDASSSEPICAGNSILEEDGRFANVSNSPHEGTVAEICDGVPKLADAPSGVYACGALLYYLTEIPTETVGQLFGSLEIVTAGQSDGQSSSADSEIAATPEFEPVSTDTTYRRAPSTMAARSPAASGSSPKWLRIN